MTADADRIADARDTDRGGRLAGKGGDRCDSGAAAGSEEPVPATAPVRAQTRAEVLADARALRANGPASDGRGWYRDAAQRRQFVADALADLAALSSAGLTVVPTESLPEWRCPSCGAVTRARMADTPTGEPREEWCVRRPDGALIRDFTREQAVDLIRIEETCADGIRGCELMRRTVHTGPWLPAEPEQEL